MYRNPPSKPLDNRRSRLLATGIALAVVAAGCGGGVPSTGCDGVTTEPQAADSAIHVLANGNAEYLSDPPTSGPHIAWTAPAVVNRPLTKPEQTGILETGDVLVQYRPDDVDDELVQELAIGLPERAHLAPNPDLPSTVVLTAHLTKQLCASLDPVAIDDFADKYAGTPVDQPPVGDGNDNGADG
ncbi:MAG: DUF3105 domain-containing protein [Actinomycetota bacterium]|jgi:hypothetical protein|nr:DUF3105 domain-containing protein [Actinomycetota bacterium]